MAFWRNIMAFAGFNYWSRVEEVKFIYKNSGNSTRCILKIIGTVETNYYFEKLLLKSSSTAMFIWLEFFHNDSLFFHDFYEANYEKKCNFFFRGKKVLFFHDFQNHERNVFFSYDFTEIMGKSFFFSWLHLSLKNIFSKGVHRIPKLFYITYISIGCMLKSDSL